MATVGAVNLTLLDIMKRTNPDGSPAVRIVELLTQRNALLKDAVWKEGNLPTGERVTSRTGLPGVAWRRYNEGVTPGKSKTDQWDEAVGQLEGLSVVDRRLAQLNGNEAAYRYTEDQGFLQSMNNEAETRLFYGSTKLNPEVPMGLAPRFDASTSIGGSQIISGAGVTANKQASIWLVKWGLDSAYCIYPKGSNGGIEMTDLGLQLWDDGTGKKFMAYVTNWNWRLGLVVRDWRMVVRIANNDTTALALTGGSNGSLAPVITNMIKGTHQVFDKAGGGLAFYFNRLLGAYLHLQAVDAVKNSTLAIKEVAGEPVLTFMGIPCRETDALLNTEAVVS